MSKKVSTGRTPSKKFGHKKIPIDWDQVKKLCKIQCTNKEIASFFETSENVLANAVREMFDCTSSEKFNMWREGGFCSLRRKQWHLADTSAAVCIFLGKQYLGQTDNYNVDHKSDFGFHIVNYGSKEAVPWKGETIEINNSTTSMLDSVKEVVTKDVQE